MTREEAIKRIQDHMEVHHIGQYPHIHIKEAMDMAIAALQEQEKRRWIPVTEKLPDDGDSVIVVVSGKVGNLSLHDAIEFAKFSIDEGWILEMWPEWEDPKVTYWMPCPEPPKEDA